MKKNFKNLLMLSIVAGSFAFYSCRESEDAKDEPAEPMQNEMHHEGEMDHEMDDDEPGGEVGNAEFENENVAAAYEQYLDLKDALVATDAEEAQQQARDLLSRFEEAEVGDKLSNSAQRIAELTDVNQQREVFSDLTSEMENFLEGNLTSGEIYKQYCPMAFEGKGDYWFSNSKEIRNPYFGDKMLKCGRVEETIN